MEEDVNGNKDRPGNEPGKTGGLDHTEFRHKLSLEEERKIIAGVSAMFTPAPQEDISDEFGNLKK